MNQRSWGISVERDDAKMVCMGSCNTMWDQLALKKVMGGRDERRFCPHYFFNEEIRAGEKAK